MREPWRTFPVVGAIVLVLAACGSGAPSGAPIDTGDTTTQGSSQPATPTPGVGDPSPVETAGGGGGGGTGDVCGLVSPDELAGILGAESVVLAVIAGPPDTCDIQTGDGAPLGATVLTTSDSIGGAAVSITFDVWAGASDSVDVSGLGDRATYSPSSLLLLVLKGDALLSIALFDDGRSEEERLELMKQIAVIAAGRM